MKTLKGEYLHTSAVSVPLLLLPVSNLPVAHTATSAWQAKENKSKTPIKGSLLTSSLHLLTPAVTLTLVSSFSLMWENMSHLVAQVERTLLNANIISCKVLSFSLGSTY